MPVSGGIGNFDWFEIELNDEKIVRNEADWYSDISGSPENPDWRIRVISGDPRTIGGWDPGRWVRYDDIDFKGAQPVSTLSSIQVGELFLAMQ